MIQVDNVIISDDIKENYFLCDLTKCKGACCVEGDLGAPLEKDELNKIKSILPKVRPYMSERGKKSLDQNGPYTLDEEQEYSTTTVNGEECVFAFYDENNIVKCSIEKAWQEKKIQFRKPISCHLYPIRAKNYDQFTALNYDRWDICSPACSHGMNSKVPLYKFLRIPLIRRFGKAWYKKFKETITHQDSSTST